MTWLVRNQKEGECLPDARDGQPSYPLQELHNAVWFSAPSPSNADEDSGEWFRLADGRRAYLMTVDLTYFHEDGSAILKTDGKNT
jgi:hypothetical protein